MIVLSLFDGMSCGYEALKRAGITVTKYYASEIDKHAMIIAKKNHPDIGHLGDVNGWRDWQIEKPDLIIMGSPCQGFSFAGQALILKSAPANLRAVSFQSLLRLCLMQVCLRFHLLAAAAVL